MNDEVRKGLQVAFINSPRGDTKGFNFDPRALVTDMHRHFLGQGATFSWDDGGTRLHVSHLRPDAHKAEGRLAGWNDPGGR